VDARGNVVLRKTLRRSAVSNFFANLPPCLIGMEASNGAHHWARVLSELGHEVRLISPQFVTPYVKSNKNDRNDAEAICEAVGRPTMRFVPRKSVDQLGVQAIHRIRSRLVGSRTGLVNQIRGVLSEHGIVIARNIAKLRQAIAEQKQQIAQLDNDRMTEVTKDLRDTQARLLEVIPRLMNAQAVLNRIQIRSPYTGRVVGLNIFSVGGVINRGEKILDVVPDQDSLVVEAQIGVDDISDVHPNARAEVHLTAYKQRIIPIVHGDVIQVSADRLTDPKTGNPYYTALVRVDEQELAALPNIQLYPGMPAQVQIPTTERTAFQYIVGPLVMSFNQAFRQK